MYLTLCILQDGRGLPSCSSLYTSSILCHLALVLSRPARCCNLLIQRHFSFMEDFGIKPWCSFALYTTPVISRSYFNSTEMVHPVCEIFNCTIHSPLDLSYLLPGPFRFPKYFAEIATVYISSLTNPLVLWLAVQVFPTSLLFVSTKSPCPSFHLASPSTSFLLSSFCILLGFHGTSFHSSLVTILIP